MSFSEFGIVIALNSIETLHPESSFEPPCVIQGSLGCQHLIHVGAFTGIYGGTIGHSSIGRYCSISQDVVIAADQHPVSWLSTSMIQYVDNLHDWDNWLVKRNAIRVTPKRMLHFQSNKPVTIGNDVWIGQGAFIKSGVSIGDGAVLAAHSVVTKDVEPYHIVAGVPAKTIKTRFSNALIERMLKLKWWDYAIMDLGLVDFSNPEACLDTLEDLISKKSLAPYKPEKISVASVEAKVHNDINTSHMPH